MIGILDGRAAEQGRAMINSKQAAEVSGDVAELLDTLKAIYEGED